MNKTHRLVFSALLIGVLASGASAATPEAKCQAGKNLEAGKLGFCLQKAERALVSTTGQCSVTSTLSCNRDAECPGAQTCNKNLTKYDDAVASCNQKFSEKWLGAEQKATEASTSCPSSGDETAMQSLIESHVGTVASLLNGGALPGCGDSSVNVAGEQCDGSDLDGATCTSLGIPGGTLACTSSCEFDTSSCTAGCGTCGNAVREGLESCDGSDLGGESCQSIGFSGGSLACTLGCGFNVSSCTAAGFPATGQTAQYAGNDDGALQAGSALAYTDNGDGTITDDATGLVWEKKLRFDSVVNAADPHDADNCYPWAGLCSSDSAYCGVDADCSGGQTCSAAISGGCIVGATIFQWVSGLNAANFAGYNDWRIPNIKELNSILDLGTYSPAVDAAFHGASCGSACADATSPACSCTSSYFYWSSTSVGYVTSAAWQVEFGSGLGGNFDKAYNGISVRAVRGGS